VASYLVVWRIYVAGNKSILPVKRPIFLADINQILSVSADFHKSHQHQNFHGNPSNKGGADTFDRRKEKIKIFAIMQTRLIILNYM
jgi:hypothetical protein